MTSRRATSVTHTWTQCKRSWNTLTLAAEQLTSVLIELEEEEEDLDVYLDAYTPETSRCELIYILEKNMHLLCVCVCARVVTPTE